MIPFMLGVLGSVMFWCIFIPVDFVIAIMVMKSVFPDALKPFISNERIYESYGDADFESWTFALFMIVIFIVAWPIILMGVILYKISSIFFPILAKYMSKLINVIPTVSIKKEE